MPRSASSPAPSTRVLVCDDDPIVREALAAYLDREEDLEVVAVEETAEAALARIEELEPEVVLMDLVLPGMDGIAATSAIVERRPHTSVLVLTTFGTEEQARAALGVGAAGFLLKTTTATAIVAAVRAARQEAVTVLSPVIAANIAATGRAESEERDADGDAAAALGLSEREQEVLAAVCRASSNAEIAHELGVTESTVKSHVTALNAKLGCRSRVALTVRAFTLGLVALPPDRREQGGRD